MTDLNSLGLSLVCDFITSEEETKLLEKINKKEFKKSKSRNSIQRYGSSAPYKSNMVSDTIPDFLDEIATKLVEDGFLEKKSTSVTVNEYFTGQCIAPHIDSQESGAVITVLSLGCEATMVFNCKDLTHTVILPPRSIVQMKDDIRNKWKHSIEPVSGMRYSIVFRR